MDSEQKYLLTIELEEKENILVRSVLLNRKVELSEIEFYYHVLLGFANFTIRVREIEVPDSFTLSLIGSNGSEVPKHFPAHDHETTQEGLVKYYELIDHVCKMEKMRAECGILQPSSTTSTSQPVPKISSRYTAWIQEVMEAFRKATVDEEEIVAEDNETIAWIFTPVLQEIRETRGSRIITDTDVGKQWVHQLGSELFPDLVVRRRLSTVDWRFQHPTSNILAKSAIEWYIQAQLVGEAPKSGISPWILRADEDLLAVFTPFKNLGPRQTFDLPPSEKGVKKEKIHPLLHILRRLEGDHILSLLSQPPTENEESEIKILELTKDVWNRYLRHVFKMYGIGSDVMDSCWGPVEDLVNVWIRGSHGVRLDRGALFAPWQPLWELLIPTKPCLDRFMLFLRTLDVYDPILAITLTNSTKYELANDWIKLYVDMEMIVDEKGRISATQFYSDVREWCLRYTPLTVFDNALKATNIGPTMTKLGFPCHRTKQGRKLMGIRYRTPPTTTVDSDDEAPTQKSVLSYMLRRETTDGIQIIAGTQIHLGSV